MEPLLSLSPEKRRLTFTSERKGNEEEEAAEEEENNSNNNKGREREERQRQKQHREAKRENKWERGQEDEGGKYVEYQRRRN